MPKSLLRQRPVRENMRFFGVWAFESQHDDRFRMSPTTHRFPKLLLIREGMGTIRYGMQEASCKAGDLVVIEAGKRHWLVDQVGQPMSLLGLGISPKLLTSVPQGLDLIATGVFGPEKIASLNVEHRMRRLLYLERQSDAARQLACVGGAIELFAELMMTLFSPSTQSRLDSDSPGEVTQVHLLASKSTEPAHAIHPLVQSYLVWLRDHFYEDLDLDHACRACQMSRRHFTACFRQATNTSWLDYVHQLRIRYAIELLQQTDRKVTSIAFSSGFRDLTTFYRVLAKLTGKRPTDYRVPLPLTTGLGEPATPY